MFVYIIAIVMCMYDCNTGVNYVVNSIYSYFSNTILYVV